MITAKEAKQQADKNNENKKYEFAKKVLSGGIYPCILSHVKKGDYKMRYCLPEDTKLRAEELIFIGDCLNNLGYKYEIYCLPERIKNCFILEVSWGDIE